MARRDGVNRTALLGSLAVTALAASCSTSTTVQPGLDGGSGTGGADAAVESGGRMGAGGSAGSAGGVSGTSGGGNGGNAGDAGVADGGAGNEGGIPDPDGYVRTGAWHGWTWTQASASASITRPDFARLPVCASGVVPPTIDASGFARLGVNLNQAADPGTPPAHGVIPTESGVVVDVTNTAASPLLLELISSASGDIWCLPLYGGGGFYPWSSFKSRCATPGGTSYSGTLPITALAILVPGNSATAVPFDFCLNGFREADTGVIGSCDTANVQCSPSLIDDFEGQAGLIYSQDGRSGRWITYDDGSGGTQTVINPSAPGHMSAHAIQVKGSGFSVWGSGLGARLNFPPGSKPHPYDASRYAGVRFWYQSKTALAFGVRTAATTSIYDTYVAGGTCTLSVGDCASFAVELPVATSWTEVRLAWDQIPQPSWSMIAGTVLDPKTLVELRFETHANDDFDYFVDDLAFF